MDENKSLFVDGLGRMETDEDSRLKPQDILKDKYLNAYGLYSKADIEEARYSKYGRFGRVLDPYSRLNDTREHLFFVKPDLHICSTGTDLENGYGDGETIKANGLTLNPQLNNNAYFRDLIERYPDVVKELQNSAGSNNKDPFSHLLSFTVNSNLDLPGSDASTLDTSNTIFGTNLEYLKDAEISDENPSFSLEFVDTKRLEVYQYFKAYSMYHIARKSGIVTPPHMDYIRYKRLHNVMGIFKFLIAEDGETIVHYSYFWGVFPTSVPREAFSNQEFNDGLTFSISFKAAFFEDSDPRILDHFNHLMLPLISDPNAYLPIVNSNYYKDTNVIGSAQGISTIGTNNEYGKSVNYEIGPSSLTNGILPKAALVDGRLREGETVKKYRLRWYE